jgi:hypothetical protein
VIPRPSLGAGACPLHCAGCEAGHCQSVAQFIERRLGWAWRNRRRAAARAAARSGTASCAITTAIRAGDDVAEIRRHLLNTEHAGYRRLRRAVLRRRSDLVVRRAQLGCGRQCREDQSRERQQCNGGELGLGHDRARLPRHSQPIRSTVCSALSRHVSVCNVLAFSGLRSRSLRSRSPMARSTIAMVEPAV